MKTPEEIKTGVEFCTTKVISGNLKTCDLDCPYRVEGVWCRNALSHDTLAYIQQLEQERIMMMNTVSKMCGKTQRWISVEERVPEDDENVLVYCIGNNEDSVVAMTSYTHNMYCYNIEGWRSPWQYFFDEYKITHWMPLPEPPVEV